MRLLLGGDKVGMMTEVELPVLASGRVHELVSLSEVAKGAAWTVVPPDGAEGGVTVRPVGRVEAHLRMAYRVWRAFRRLSRQERLSLGLTLTGAIRDLPCAYAQVSALRWPADYASWVRRFGRPSDAEKEKIRDFVAGLAVKPRFVVVLLQAEKATLAEATRESLREQLYPHWTLREIESAGSVEPLTAALDPDDWLMVLRAGDRLAPDALAWFAAAAAADEQAYAFYADDDVIDASGRRHSPRFKPDWSLTHFRATDFVGRALVLRAREVLAAGGIDQECLRYGPYGLVLRIVDALGDDGRVRHVPAVLLHREQEEEDPVERETWRRAAVARHLKRRGIGARVVPAGPNICRVRFPLPDPAPLVSIIIPTRDAANLLRQCVESLLAKTEYPNFEVLVVDNRSREPDALAYLRSLHGRPTPGGEVRVLRYDDSFNFSAINNFAVRHARGEFVCLLNNDTEAITPDWLAEMVGHLTQPGVGAVGAKLLFPDGRVQHAGDVVGPGGCANHLHTGIGRDDPGYCNRAVVAQELSAVTAACLLTRKSLYEAVGGMDARFLRVAYNDVDYCLKLRRAGYKVVWTPHAELFHHESVSRGRDKRRRDRVRAKFEVFVMRRRWRREMQNDPFYNPNLNYARTDFTVGHFRRVRRPWD